MARIREKRRRAEHPDDVRMSLGEHLEELRTRLIRSLLALLAACLICIWPAKYLLEFIARPVILALRRHGQPDNLLSTSPPETMFIYIKVVVFAGVVLASPYILHQLWSFVAAGLYQHERRWVGRLVPVSVGLFLTGAAFMYTVVLLVSLNFLVGFSSWIPLPQATATSAERALIGEPPAVVKPDGAPAVPTSAPAVSVLSTDPPAPPPGAIWFNELDNRLKFQTPTGVFSIQLLRDDARGLVTTHFKIDDYLNFVLLMTIAFGLAFQMPLVVVFLAGSGLFPVERLRKSRKVVILIIVIIAGMLAPPDLLSHVLLSAPMVLLFEIGLLVAARQAKRREAAEAEEAEVTQAAPK